MMPSMYGVVLRSFLAPLPLACSLLGIPCLVVAMLFPLTEVAATIEALREHLRGTQSYALP